MLYKLLNGLAREIHSNILGRAIKTEYLSLATLGSVVGLTLLSGGSKKADPAPGKSIIEKAKEAVPINAGSRFVCMHFPE